MKGNLYAGVGTAFLRERWCRATLSDALDLFHLARVHPDNEAEALETIAVRCCNTAFQDRAHLIVGGREDAAKMFGEMAMEKFKDEILKLVTAPTEKEELVA